MLNCRWIYFFNGVSWKYFIRALAVLPEIATRCLVYFLAFASIFIRTNSKLLYPKTRIYRETLINKSIVVILICINSKLYWCSSHRVFKRAQSFLISSTRMFLSQHAQTSISLNKPSPKEPKLKKRNPILRYIIRNYLRLNTWNHNLKARGTLPYMLDALGRIKPETASLLQPALALQPRKKIQNYYS